MKRTFIFFAALITHFSLFAEKTIVWTGDMAISWNPEVFVGEQFETPTEMLASVQKGDILELSVVAKMDEPQYVLTYKAGESWAWTDLTTTLTDTTMSYTIESEIIATEIATRGIVIRGQGFHLTQIAIISDAEPNDDPVDDPNEETGEYDYTGLVETIIYQPQSPVAISWDNTLYEGIKLDTREINETCLAGLQEGHIIRVTIAEAQDNAEYSMQYKHGDDWAWTPLNINTATEGYIAYKVESDEMAQLLADRGLVIQGIYYKVSQISVFGTEALPSAVDNINAENNLHNNIRYNLFGQIVDENYRGIVIINGKKVLVQ